MKETILEEERVLPVLAVRGLVVFPGMIVQFDIGRKKSVLAAKAALDTDSRELFIVTQTDLSESEPMAEDLYKIGVIARIKQLGAVAVRKMDGIEETIKFPLPKGLKIDEATGLEIEVRKAPETGH